MYSLLRLMNYLGPGKYNACVFKKIMSDRVTHTFNPRRIYSGGGVSRSLSSRPAKMHSESCLPQRRKRRRQPHFYTSDSFSLWSIINSDRYHTCTDTNTIYYIKRAFEYLIICKIWPLPWDSMHEPWLVGLLCFLRQNVTLYWSSTQGDPFALTFWVVLL